MAFLIPSSPPPHPYIPLTVTKNDLSPLLTPSTLTLTVNTTVTSLPTSLVTSSLILTTPKSLIF